MLAENTFPKRRCLRRQVGGRRYLWQSFAVVIQPVAQADPKWHQIAGRPRGLDRIELPGVKRRQKRITPSDGTIGDAGQHRRQPGVRIDTAPFVIDDPGR